MGTKFQKYDNLKGNYETLLLRGAARSWLANSYKTKDNHCPLLAITLLVTDLNQKVKYCDFWHLRDPGQANYIAPLFYFENSVHNSKIESLILYYCILYMLLCMFNHRLPSIGQFAMCVVQLAYNQLIVGCHTLGSPLSALILDCLGCPCRAVLWLFFYLTNVFAGFRYRWSITSLIIFD